MILYVTRNRLLLSMTGFFSFYSILTVFLTVIYLYGLNVHIERLRNNNLYLICCFILLFFSMFRGVEVGGDLNEYLPYFERIKDYNSIKDLFQYSLISGYEFGFGVICRIINLFTNSPRGFIIITSFLSLIGPFYFIYHYSNEKIFSLILYVLNGFYNISFNSVRQALAMSFAILALCALLKCKTRKYLILTIVATLVHTSAFVSFFFFPIYKLRQHKKIVFISIVSSFVLFVLLKYFLLQYFISTALTKYDDNMSEALVAGTGYNLLLVRIIILFICIQVLKMTKNNLNIQSYYMFKFLMLLVLFSVFIQLCSTLMATIMRLSYYLYLPIIVLLPNLLHYIKNIRKRRILYLSTYMLFFCLMCITFLSSPNGLNTNQTATIPYVFLDGVFIW